MSTERYGSGPNPLSVGVEAPLRSHLEQGSYKLIMDRPGSRAGGKKRKLVIDEQFERTAYSSFVQAANSISQLYQQSVQTQRKSAATATKQTLVGSL